MIFVLFSNEGGDVGLESTSTNTHDDKTNGKDSNGCIGLGNDLGNGGKDQQDMAHNGDDVGVLNREVTTPVLISDPGSEEWCEV